MPHTLQTILEKIQADNEQCLQFVAGITEAQFTAKPTSGWSIAEILEHVVLTDKMIYVMLRRSPGEQAQPTFLLGEKTLEEKIVQQRGQKLKAPDALQPKNIFHTRAAGEEAFMEIRHKYLHDLQNHSITINQGVHKHPYLGVMTVADWLYFIVLHRQRHFLQAQEVLQQII